MTVTCLEYKYEHHISINLIINTSAYASTCIYFTVQPLISRLKLQSAGITYEELNQRTSQRTWITHAIWSFLLGLIWRTLLMWKILRGTHTTTRSATTWRNNVFWKGFAVLRNLVWYLNFVELNLRHDKIIAANLQKKKKTIPVIMIV